MSSTKTIRQDLPSAKKDMMIGYKYERYERSHVGKGPGRVWLRERDHSLVRLKSKILSPQELCHVLNLKRPPPNQPKSFIWRKSHRSQITLSAVGISYNIARQVKLTPDAFGSLRHVRRILQVAAFEKCPQARIKD